jgi:aminodeoxyfutalosine deaminase
MKNQQNNAQKPAATLIKVGELYTPEAYLVSIRPHTDPAILLIPGQKPQFTHTDPQILLQRAKDYGPYEIIERPDILALPPLINAHAHLDLYAIGPKPYPGSFTAWLGMVIQARRAADYDPISSVNKGLRDSRAAGIGAIGDIAGNAAAAQARLQDGMPGVSYLETLAFPPLPAQIAAQNTRQTIRRLNRLLPPASQAALGIEPHAPYSTHALQYRRINQPRGILRCTHLAETQEEIQFLRSATGPFRDLLLKLNRWDPAFKPPGITPVAWFASLVPGPWHDWALVHCNYVTDDDIQIMARHQATVIYCPIASEYFGHKNHRYRDMLKAGIRVILGTDSAVCQPPTQANPADLWPAIQRLHQRDGMDPVKLLEMATFDAAQALRLPFNRAHAWEQGATLVRFDPQSPLPPLLSALQIPQNAFSLPAY